MNNCFINWYFKRYRFFNGNNDVLSNFERHFLNFRNMDNLLNWIWDGFLNRDGYLLYDRDDYCLRDRYLDRDGMGHWDQDGLIDFEFDVLWDRDDDLFVMFDRFWVFFVDVLVDGIGVGLQVVASEASEAPMSTRFFMSTISHLTAITSMTTKIKATGELARLIL